jgi:hypothetical protein
VIVSALPLSTPSMIANMVGNESVARDRWCAALGRSRATNRLSRGAPRYEQWVRSTPVSSLCFLYHPEPLWEGSGRAAVNVHLPAHVRCKTVGEVCKGGEVGEVGEIVEIVKVGEVGSTEPLLPSLSTSVSSCFRSTMFKMMFLLSKLSYETSSQ